MALTPLLAAGGTIGNYRIDGVLGGGGMGQVYRGMHVLLQRPAAIKVMHPHLAAEPAFRERFIQEAKAAAALRHPHIVEVYDFGEERGLLYLVTELVAGGSLRSLVERSGDTGQPLPFALAIDLARQTADGLAYAHARGMVHRDVKPDNLLLERAEGASLGPPGPDGNGPAVKICDFGLARLAAGGVSTVTGASMGTPAYMSPEQCRGAPVDGRSDVYSLGVTLYQLATGHLPFQAETLTEAIYQHLFEAPALPRRFRPDLPPEIQDIILRCLAKGPAERYASAGDLGAALAAALAAVLQTDPAVRPPGATILPVALTAPPGPPPAPSDYKAATGAPTGLPPASSPPARLLATPAPAAPPAAAPVKRSFPVWLGGLLAAAALVTALVAGVLVLRRPPVDERAAPPPTAEPALRATTNVAPTTAPPVAVPATAAPATVIPPTAVPPTAAPPTPALTPAPQAPQVVVTKLYGAALRTAPASDATSRGTIPCGARLQVLGEATGWYQVAWAPSPGGSPVQGWVGGLRVAGAGNAPAPDCSAAVTYNVGDQVLSRVQSGCLSLRQSPSRDAPFDYCVENDHQYVIRNGPVEVDGEDWFAVWSAATGDGWSLAQYLLPSR